MQSSELENIIQKFPSISKNFVGVFSIDTVPKRLKQSSFVIVNTEEASKPGQHWFCFIKLNKNRFEIFDSLGLDKAKIDRIKYFKLFPKNSIIYFNETPVQNSLSNTCGLFVLFFLIKRMHNFDLSFNNILNQIFEENCIINESKVAEFSAQHFS